MMMSAIVRSKKEEGTNIELQKHEYYAYEDVLLFGTQDNFHWRWIHFYLLKSAGHSWSGKNKGSSNKIKGAYA